MLRPHVTVIADIPTAFQNVFFDAVAERGDIDLELIYCRRTVPWRNWVGEGPKIASHSFSPGIVVGSSVFNPTLVPTLLADTHTLPIIIGYYVPAMAGLCLALEKLGRPWVFWTDSLPPPPKRSYRPTSLLRARLLRSALFGSTACVTTGRTGVDSLTAYGVPPDRVYSIPFVVDQSRLQAAVDAARVQAPAIRDKYGLPHDKRIVTFVGQIIERKGIDQLLRAFAALAPAERNTLFLVFAGAGDDLERFRNLARDLDVESFIRWLGPIANESLPELWAVSDAAVLVSRFDPWPVVVLEALGAGVPVLGSTACGSVRDRVVNGKTGWVVPPSDVSGITTALADIARTPKSRLAEMGAIGRVSMADLAPAAVAAEFGRMINALWSASHDSLQQTKRGTQGRRQVT